MDLYINFCSKRVYIIFYSGVLFYIYKSETYFVVIYITWFWDMLCRIGNPIVFFYELYSIT